MIDFINLPNAIPVFKLYKKLILKMSLALNKLLNRDKKIKFIWTYTIWVWISSSKMVGRLLAVPIIL